jgi:hypothetical protein
METSVLPSQRRKDFGVKSTISIEISLKSVWFDTLFGENKRKCESVSTRTFSVENKPGSLTLPEYNIGQPSEVQKSIAAPKDLVLICDHVLASVVCGS